MLTTTASLGWRPWQGGEAYLDIEGAQGVPLSHLAGLGGMTNGELAKTSGTRTKFYRARLSAPDLEPGAASRRPWNPTPAASLPGMVDKRRTVLTVGNLAVIDMFDDNAYNHDPRTQFMNWAMMTYGFDYAADARGYSWGAVLEWYHDDWALRLGRFLQPKEANGQPLDTRFFKHYGDQVELEHAHTPAGRPGKLRAPGLPQPHGHLALRRRAEPGCADRRRARPEPRATARKARSASVSAWSRRSAAMWACSRAPAGTMARPKPMPSPTSIARFRAGSRLGPRLGPRARPAGESAWRAITFRRAPRLPGRWRHRPLHRRRAPELPARADLREFLQPGAEQGHQHFLRLAAHPQPPLKRHQE